MAFVDSVIKALQPDVLRLQETDAGCQSEDHDDPLDGLSWLFPGRSVNQHGGAGWGFRYNSDHFGWMEFHLADPPDHQSFELFAHYLWNASIWMSIAIERSLSNEAFRDSKTITVGGRSILELGAGAGLAGVIASKAGASKVTITDYPDPNILRTISVNTFLNNQAAVASNQIEVEGLEWGELNTEFAKSRSHSYDVILAADCLWLYDQHTVLIETIMWFLTEDLGGMVAISAGFHKPKRTGGRSGRDIVEEFFQMCEKKGLIIAECWEQHEDGGGLPHERGSKYIEDEDRWTVCALLRRSQS